MIKAMSGSTVVNDSTSMMEDISHPIEKELASDRDTLQKEDKVELTIQEVLQPQNVATHQDTEDRNHTTKNEISFDKVPITGMEVSKTKIAGRESLKSQSFTKLLNTDDEYHPVENQISFDKATSPDESKNEITGQEVLKSQKTTRHQDTKNDVSVENNQPFGRKDNIEESENMINSNDLLKSQNATEHQDSKEGDYSIENQISLDKNAIIVENIYDIVGQDVTKSQDGTSLPDIKAGDHSIEKEISFENVNAMKESVNEIASKSLLKSQDVTKDQDAKRRKFLAKKQVTFDNSTTTIGVSDNESFCQQLLISEEEGIGLTTEENIEVPAREEFISPCRDEEKVIENLEVQPPENSSAWIRAVGCWAIMLLLQMPVPVFGILYSEVFMTKDVSATYTGFIYATQAFLRFASGIFVGSLCTIFGWRKVALTGSFLSGAAITISGFATSPWQLFILYSLVYGVGVGITLPVCSFVSANYFKRRRGFVMGVSMFCVGATYFLAPNLLNLLRHSFGYKGSIMILGALMLNSCVSAMLFRPVRLLERSKNVEDSMLASKQFSPGNEDMQPNYVWSKCRKERDTRQFEVEARETAEVMNASTIMTGDFTADDFDLMEETPFLKEENLAVEKTAIEKEKNTSRSPKTRESSSKPNTEALDSFGDMYNNAIVYFKEEKEKENVSENKVYVNHQSLKKARYKKLQPATANAVYKKKEKVVSKKNSSCWKHFAQLGHSDDSGRQAKENQSTKSESHTRTEKIQKRKIQLLLNFFKSIWTNLLMAKSHRIKIISLGFALILAAMLHGVMLVPFMLRERGYNLEAASWAVSTSAIFNLSARLLGSCIIDYVKFNKKYIFMAGALCIFSGLLVFALAESWIILISSLCLFSFGCGTCLMLFPLLFVEFMGPSLLPQSVTVYSLFTSLGLVISGPILGTVRDYTGNYTLTMILLSLCPLTAFLSYLFMPWAIRSDRKRNCGYEKG